MIDTFDEARDAILAPLMTVAAANLTWEMVFPDVGGVPPTTNIPWMRAIIRHTDGDQSSLACVNGQRRWTNIGTLMVQVFAPIGDGSKAAYDAAQAISNAYKAVNSSSIWFRKPLIREAGTSGDFEQINFIVTFEYDQIS